MFNGQVQRTNSVCVCPCKLCKYYVPIQIKGFLIRYGRYYVCVCVASKLIWRRRRGRRRRPGLRLRVASNPDFSARSGGLETLDVPLHPLAPPFDCYTAAATGHAGKSSSSSSSDLGGRRNVNSDDGGGGTGVRRELEEDDGNWVIGSGSRKRLMQWRCTFVDGVGVRGGRGTTMVASASASSVAAAAAAAVALAVITAAADRLRCARLPAVGNKCPVKSDPESRYDNNSIL